MIDNALLKIGEIVDKIIKQTDLGKRKSFSLDKLDGLVQELKKYGIYWDLKQVYDRLIKPKRSGSERKSGALGPMASLDYTRISSILSNDDNEAGSQRAGATITANVTTTTTATTTATNTVTATAVTTATATIAATTIATIIATTAAATAIATHTAHFDPTAVLPPLVNSMYQNNSPKLSTLQPDHVMKENIPDFSFP